MNDVNDIMKEINDNKAIPIIPLHEQSCYRRALLKTSTYYPTVVKTIRRLTLNHIDSPVTINLQEEHSVLTGP